MLIDVTRLANRMLQGRLPTGIDRVDLAYVSHFGERSSALLRFARRWVELPRRDSQLLFAALMTGGGRGRYLIRRVMVQAYALAWRRTSEGLLLNIAHSGLESLEYGFQMSRRSLRGVFFLHDLIPLSHPEYCRAGEDGRHQRRLQTMLSAGRGLVVNSAATRDALEAHAVSLGHRVPRCVVAPLPPAHFPAPGRGQPLEKPYFVVLGTIEPRKNHLLLLQVWRQLVEELGESAPHLVIVGQRGWECEQVVDLLERCPALQGNVLELSRCSDAELANWLGHAQALLFPSFVEGFGIPLVEALTCGLPVIASDLPVFREIAGDVPEYLVPLDGLGWQRAILDYASEGSPARTGQMARMVGFRAWDWERHFAIVEGLLAEIGTHG